MRRRAFLSISVGCLCACQSEKPPSGPGFEYGEAQKRYPMRGEVLRLRPENRIAVVKHEKIEGWMEAMTMEFPVPDAAQYALLKEGMTFRATVCTNDLYFWLVDIRPE